MSGLAVLVHLDGTVGSVGEVGAGLIVGTHTARGRHTGNEHIVAGAFGGIGVHHIAVLVQYQGIGLVQVVVQGIRVGI